MRDVYLWYTSPGRIQFFRLEPGIDRSRVFPEDRYRRYLSSGKMNRIMRNGQRCLPSCHCLARGCGAACRLAIRGWQSDDTLSPTVIHCPAQRQSGRLHGPTMSKSDARTIIAQPGWGWTRRVVALHPCGSMRGADSVIPAGARHRPKPGFP